MDVARDDTIPLLADAGLECLIFLFYITPPPATKQQYSSYSIFLPLAAGHGGIHVRVRVTDDVPLWPDFDDPPEDVRISTELRHKIYPNPPQRDGWARAPRPCALTCS